MGELQRYMDTQATQAAARELQLKQMEHEARVRSQERVREFVEEATRRNLGKAALYLERSIIRPKKGPVSIRYAQNDVTYNYTYLDSGWVIPDGDESGPDNKIILPNSDVYTCTVPPYGLKAPKEFTRLPYVTTSVNEHESPTPLPSPFSGEAGLHLLASALQRR